MQRVDHEVHTRAIIPPLLILTHYPLDRGKYTLSTIMFSKLFFALTLFASLFSSSLASLQNPLEPLYQAFNFQLKHPDLASYDPRLFTRDPSHLTRQYLQAKALALNVLPPLYDQMGQALLQFNENIVKSELYNPKAVLNVMEQMSGFLPTMDYIVAIKTHLDYMQFILSQSDYPIVREQLLKLIENTHALHNAINNMRAAVLAQQEDIVGFIATKLFNDDKMLIKKSSGRLQKKRFFRQAAQLQKIKGKLNGAGRTKFVQKLP